jgi:hypothetical protein
VVLALLGPCRSPIWLAGKQYIAFPVGGGAIVEELIAVSS